MNFGNQLPCITDAGSAQQQQQQLAGQYNIMGTSQAAATTMNNDNINNNNMNNTNNSLGQAHDNGDADDDRMDGIEWDEASVS